jgi:hypothetical protein
MILIEGQRTREIVLVIADACGGQDLPYLRLDLFRRAGQAAAAAIGDAVKFGHALGLGH